MSEFMADAKQVGAWVWWKLREVAAKPMSDLLVIDVCVGVFIGYSFWVIARGPV